MTIKMHRSDFMWSVTWTLDDGASWHIQARDTFADALALAAAVGGGWYPTKQEVQS